MGQITSIQKFEYISNTNNHCKLKWIFFIRSTGNKVYIEELEILENQPNIGCIGHPQTIITLIKGREISTIDIDGLSKSICRKDISCGQFLSNALSDILSIYKVKQ